ncbi:hypothetical protein NHF40_04415 [Maricaulaceae bacterium EIL42A08]|nr:hypothetical protein [Maricaulaceae bacterium EIL42A08]MCP2679735.1 hypothetical protein [Maricaulaceae bacterium NA33B04]
MTDDQRETSKPKPELTPGQIARWSLPFVISLIVPVVAFTLNWQPWFGYAAMIAGALGTLMYVGRSYGIGED